MIVLDAGARVTQLRFLPDGRLLVGTWAAGDAELVILPLPSGPRVVIPLSVRQVWDSHNELAVLDGGARLLLGLGGLVTVSTTTSEPVPGGPAGASEAVIASPDGGRIVAGYPTPDGGRAHVGYSGSGAELWREEFPYRDFRVLVAFLPGGDDYVEFAGREVRRRAFGGGVVASARYPANHVYHPQLSPDGRRLGVIGYSSMYVYDAAALGKPGKIGGTQTFGNFVGFAFHPAGRTLAVIHGGPTLVKLYDLDTLKIRTKLNWKVGPLTCVAYSPDGQLAAVGTDDGRVVVWDADE